ncbi:hypothetical protein [Gulosibacter molinativorax]|uniref:Uncharacterized protein n=1 Tax=Gulosibacter molinativorax TaxID=256821 RepID=A0ABT7CAJ2_9MICO|nr:hypothetical protein [Gulosibacter molinativorax]MDJ1372231.1 hypothetical protein [Gulosibacter molinativorax]QUY63487.1 Hypotetical protein [Gulosibacter molinativorax]
MSPREFRPPEPVYKQQDAAEPEPSGPARRPRGLLLAAIIAGVVVIALGITLGTLWGKTTEPVALDAGTAPGATETPAESGPTDTDLIGPDATNPPHTVARGDTVPINVDAQFPNGVKLVPPALGDWSEQDIINRPDQFTAVSPGYGASIEVWQTSVFGTPQSDEALTIAQLNRISDECSPGGDTTPQGEPVVDTFTGTDDTKLEVLIAKVTGCDGGELWLIERVMPLSGTRFHVVLWDAYSVEDNEELMAMYDAIRFEF